LVPHFLAVRNYDAPETDTRTLINAAALAEFREHGYERATVRGIAERAGIRISTLYAHIASKEELFLALVAPVLDQAARDLAAIRASGAPLKEQLRQAIVTGATQFDAHDPELFIYLADFFPAAADGAHHAYDTQWAELIEEGRAAGLLRADVDSKVIAYGILGMINWMHQWYRPDGRLRAREIGEQFAAMVIDGLAR
jgi:AcrR family transcriptional regulator